MYVYFFKLNYEKISWKEWKEYIIRANVNVKWDIFILQSMRNNDKQK